MNTQLTNPLTYDVGNMIFAKAQSGSAGIAGNGPTIKYFRIPISTRNPDGSIGELVFQTERLFSFGLSRNTDAESGKVTGYTFPLCMWNKDGATPAEKAFSEIINKVVERCKDHLVLETTRVEIKKFTLTRGGLDSLGNFMYWKRDPETGRVLEDKGPVLYPKLIESKKNNKIVTSIFDANGNDIDPLTLEKKYCWVKAAIKIESIYVGSKISLQVKMYEAEVQPVESGRASLLRRPVASSLMSVDSSIAHPLTTPAEDDEQIRDDEDMMDVSISNAPAAAAAVPPRKVVKKIVTKK